MISLSGRLNSQRVRQVFQQSLLGTGDLLASEYAQETTLAPGLGYLAREAEQVLLVGCGILRRRVPIDYGNSLPAGCEGVLPDLWTVLRSFQHIAERVLTAGLRRLHSGFQLLAQRVEQGIRGTLIHQIFHPLFHRHRFLYNSDGTRWRYRDHGPADLQWGGSERSPLVGREVNPGRNSAAWIRDIHVGIIPVGGNVLHGRLPFFYCYKLHRSCGKPYIALLL